MLEVSIIGIFSGILACCILLSNLDRAPLANKLLFWVIFPLTVAPFMFYLYLSRLALHVPYLYRLPAPLYLVFYPAAYLYVRTYLSDRQTLQRKDYLHFLPAILHTIQMIPYHLQPIEVKRGILNDLYKHGERMVEFREGGLPPYVQFGVLFLQGLIYCLLMYRLVYRASRRGAPGLLHTGKRWLSLLTTLLLLVSFMLFFTYILPIERKDSIVNWWMLSVMLAMALVTINLFFRPDILYGVPMVRKAFLSAVQNTPVGSDALADPHAGEAQDHPGEGSAVEASGLFGEADEGVREIGGNDFSYLNVYAPLIQKHFEEARPFLQKGYTINQLSEETGIPVHHLSAYFNKVCGTRFNDFVNQHRLNFIEDLAGGVAFEQFTQEGLAWEAGFSSRISFFNALKKLRGVTPAEFLVKARSKR